MSWRAAGALILLIAAFALGWYSGSLSGRLTAANRSADLALKELQDAKDRDAEQAKRAEKLQKTLDRLPKSEGKVREIVRENPSKCDRPAAVSERVREAAREANSAREMPSDF